MLIALATSGVVANLSRPVESPALLMDDPSVIPLDDSLVPGASEPETFADHAVPGGRFYHGGADTSNELLGYTIKGVLWQVFGAAGGVAALGYPISHQWADAEGRWNQAFQRGILQVTVADGMPVQAVRANALDLLSAAGKDDWLEESLQIPRSADWSADAKLSRRHAEREHLKVLDGDPAIRQVFLADPNWRQRFGLPLAIERYENVVTVRAQRAVIRHWLVDQPRAIAGSVEVIDGGELAKVAALLPADAARPQVSARYGWLRVAGRQIVDPLGNPVRLSGINWSGFELNEFVPRGLGVRDYTEIINRIAGFGFNTIRLPYSDEMIARNPVPNQSLVAGCPACRGKRALEIMDMIVAYAGAKGLRVIIDNHFSHASGYGVGLWYTKDYPDDVWLKHWTMLAERYRENPAVVGFDLRNEPHGEATWGSGDPATDWRLAAERAGEAILAINPNLLLIVEGIELHPKPGGGMDRTWWGGNLQGARQFPVRLPAANLVYSAHDYGPMLYGQHWFNRGTTFESLQAVWQSHWAYLNLELDQPLLVGEFGTGNQPSDITNEAAGSQGQWFQALLALLRQRDNLHWMYWSVNAEDEFALFDRSYAGAANPEKVTALASAMGPAFPALPAPPGTEIAAVDGHAQDGQVR